MPKKEIVTLKEIERDIIHSLKKAPEISESTYKKWAIPFGILGGVFGILTLIQPKIGMTGLLILLMVGIVGIVIETVLFRYKIKSVCIEDYKIESAVLSHVEEEHYKVKGAGVKTRHSRLASVYTLHFENGRSLRLPKDNYSWSQERLMSDFAIYQSSHRGDPFIIVVKKDSEEIVMAYPTDFFEYKE